tara:strand:- start:3169 stop:4062 length:894 start_codon:yes stop_codon:yes gene_type:complete
MAAIPSSGPILKDLLESPFNKFAATPEAKGLIENALAGNYTGKGSFGLNEDGTTGVPEGSDWASGVNEEDLLELLNGGDIQANTGGSAYDKLDKEYQDKINAPGSSIDEVEADKIREILRNNEEKFKASDFNETLIASADTGAAPIGTYKEGDAVVEPIGPADDTDAERIWQNMLNKSEDQPVSVLSPQEQGRLDVNDALLNDPTDTIQLPPKVTAGVDLDDKGIYGLSGGLNIPRGDGMFTGGVNVGLPYNIDTPFGVQQVDPTISGQVGYRGKNIGVNVNYQPRGSFGMGGNVRF